MLNDIHPTPIPARDKGPMKQLYPEQQEARYGINAMLNAGISHVFVSPCGTGKTFTSTAVIQDRIRLGKRVYVLTPQIEINAQWLEELTEMGLNPGYVNDEGMRGSDRSVYVCMFQSLVGLIHTIPESLWPDEIIIDETQHMLCSSIIKICSYFENATRLGLTATLYHNSGETFRPWFTETIQTITKQQAIDNGYITESVLIVPDDYLAFADIPDLGKEYDMNAQAEALGKTKIVGDMIETYERLFCGKPVIVPCATFEQSKQIKEMFCDAGWNFEHVHSDGMAKHERKRILSDIANQRINGLCTVGIGVEGLSIKGLWGVLWAKRTKSPITWTQFNGRGERLYEGKRHCLIVDFVGNSIIHGHPAHERKWTLDGEEHKEDGDSVPFQKCYSCGTYNAVENHECHWCGADLSDEARLSNKKPRQLPTMIDGKMVAITTDGEIQDIKDRAERIKAEQKEIVRVEKEKRESAETVTQVDKRKALKEGLFSNSVRRSLFQDAIGGW